MQVPERIALIGGSILIASTMVFGLKGQAASILTRIAPAVQVNNDNTAIIQMQHEAFSFTEGFQYAERNHWTTGQWGTSKYYIDDQGTLYLGKGAVDGALASALGNKADQIKNINFKEAVQAPRISVQLLANLAQLEGMRNLSNLDTSNTIEMQGMFSSDPRLKTIDVSNLNTQNVYDMSYMFYSDGSLNDVHGLDQLYIDNVRSMNFMFADATRIQHIDLSGWHTNDMQNMEGAFAGTHALQSLDLSNFDTSSTKTSYLFGYQSNDDARLSSLTLGEHTLLSDDIYLRNGNWQNGGQTLNNDQLTDRTSHVGTWIKQYSRLSN